MEDLSLNVVSYNYFAVKLTDALIRMIVYINMNRVILTAGQVHDDPVQQLSGRVKTALLLKKKIIIPTYEQPEPEEMPMFSENRVSTYHGKPIHVASYLR